MCFARSPNPIESIAALDNTEEEDNNDENDDHLSEQSSPNVGGGISPRMEVNEVLNNLRELVIAVNNPKLDNDDVKKTFHKLVTSLTGGHVLREIDAPGLPDTADLKQDQQNFKYTLRYISTLKDLNGIAIPIHMDEYRTKLRQHLRQHLRHLQQQRKRKLTKRAKTQHVPVPERKHGRRKRCPARPSHSMDVPTAE